LRRQVRDLEKQIEQQKSVLLKLDEQLADENLYNNAERVGEFTSLLKDRADAALMLQNLEDGWLTASADLESETN